MEKHIRRTRLINLLSEISKDLRVVIVDDVINQLSELHEAIYHEGVADGIRRFAWWKDGIQYVGSCGTTLQSALEELEK